MIRRLLLVLLSVGALSACSLIESLLIEQIAGDTVFDSVRDALMDREAKQRATISSTDIVDFPIPPALAAVIGDVAKLGSIELIELEGDLDELEASFSEAEKEEIFDRLKAIAEAEQACTSGVAVSVCGVAAAAVATPSSAGGSEVGPLRFGSYRSVSGPLESGLGPRRDIVAEFVIESAYVAFDVGVGAPSGSRMVRGTMTQLVQVGLLEGFRDPPGEVRHGFGPLYESIAAAYAQSPTDAVFSTMVAYRVPHFAFCFVISGFRAYCDIYSSQSVPVAIPVERVAKVEQILGTGAGPDAVFVSVQLLFDLPGLGLLSNPQFRTVDWSVRAMGYSEASR